MSDVKTSERTAVKPAWYRFYAVTALGVGAFGLVDAVTRKGTARTLMELVVTVVVFGSMALWVRGNRVALDLAQGCRCVPGRHARPVSVQTQPRDRVAVAGPVDREPPGPPEHAAAGSGGPTAVGGA